MKLMVFMNLKLLISNSLQGKPEPTPRLEVNQKTND